MNMETLELVLRVLLVLDALALIGLVLLQQGRGASMGAAFGSGASATMFGSAGATGFLTRLTTFLAVGFFVLTFALAWSAKARNEASLELSLPKASAPAEVSELPESETPALEGAGELPEAP
jgi:preprotein translocase subunit SecG